jgi:bifunctional DNase/RNase
MEEGAEIAVTVVGVFETTEVGEGPFLLLRDAGQRVFPIVIGPWEALAIQVVLHQSPVPRPLTHDLIQTLLERLDARLERIVIDDLSHDTFYARLELRSHGASLSVDARPSDAVALALRMNAPIYATEAVIARAGIPHDAD